MFTFFSIIVILSPIAVIISAILWAISAVRKKPAKAKRVLVVSAALFVISFIGCALTAPPVEKKDTEEQPSAVQSTAPEQSQKPAQGPVSAPSGDHEGIVPAESQEPTEGPQEPAQPAEPTNPLSALAVQEHPVMNGIKTERIGTWASITTTKEFFSNATDEQVFQYLNEVAENEYNWINVFFEDGTGLYCIGSMGGFSLEYGSIDKNEGGPPPLFEGRMFMFNSEDKVYQEQGKNVDEAAINEVLAEKIPQSYQASKWFQAYASATGTTDNSASVTIQVDQGSDNQENAQALATQFYGTVKEVVESAGCQLESLDVTVVNNGSPVGLYFTEDGKSYTLLRNGKRSEFEIP